MQNFTHHQSTWEAMLFIFLNLSKLTHLQSFKRSLVGVGGLEVRGRQCLTLTSVRHLMVARYRKTEHLAKKQKGKPKLPSEVTHHQSTNTSKPLNNVDSSKSTHRKPQVKPYWCRWTRSPGTTASCFDIGALPNDSTSKAKPQIVFNVSLSTP